MKSVVVSCGGNKNAAKSLINYFTSFFITSRVTNIFHSGIKCRRTPTRLQEIKKASINMNFNSVLNSTRAKYLVERVCTCIYAHV